MTSRNHALDQVLQLATRYWEHKADYLQQSAEVGKSWVPSSEGKGMSDQPVDVPLTTAVTRPWSTHGESLHT